LSGPEIKNNGLAVKVGRLPTRKPTSSTPWRRLTSKSGASEPCSPLLVPEVIANTIAAIMAMDAAAAIPYLAKFFG